MLGANADIGSRMQKTIDSLNHDYSKIRAGRANPALLDSITVDYYGTPTPLNQMAGISVAEARLLVIQPWDKSVLGDIEKAIQVSDIGINPQNDGTVIRLNFPPLTEDRRKEIAKDISKRAEDAKVAIRNIRRDGMDELKKMKEEISEDIIASEEEALQKITDKFTAEIDKISADKEKEILSM